MHSTLVCQGSLTSAQDPLDQLRRLQMKDEIYKKALAWLRTDRATDPIFSSEETQASIERSCSHQIQPYSQCAHRLYPTVAQSSGFSDTCPLSQIEICRSWNASLKLATLLVSQVFCPHSCTREAWSAGLCAATQAHIPQLPGAQLRQAASQ